MSFLDLPLQNFVQSDAACALGWAILYSLWEGAAVALALALLLRSARSAKLRYAASCIAMLVLLAGFALTFFYVLPHSAGALAPARALPPALPSPGDPAISTHSLWGAADLLPWLAPFWIVGVLLFQLRCVFSWMAAGRMRRVGTCAAPSEWTRTLDRLRSSLPIARPVNLLESCFTEVPVVLGHLRPVILMPLGLLAGLPAAQIELILLHELAHIRRADYLVNLMQTLAEGLLFYHPAAWWISNMIRIERENCCDDVVVAATGDAHQYAQALTALAENDTVLRGAPAATGGNLMNRIRRLLQSDPPRATLAPVISAGMLIITCAAILTAWQAPTPFAPPHQTLDPTQNGSMRLPTSSRRKKVRPSRNSPSMPIVTSS